MGIVNNVGIVLSCLLIYCTLFTSMHVVDEDALQDFCVADNTSKVLVNGFVCKPLIAVQAKDFKSSALKNPRNVAANPLGAIVTPTNVMTFAGLNTLGVSSARTNYAPGGLNPPHVDPRATELLFLVQGTLYVGFVNNTLFAETLYPGDSFVFPRGLIHFQLNIGKEPAFAIVGFNGQNPGVSQVAKAVFASNPPINDDVIAKAFQLYPDLVQKLRSHSHRPLP